MSARGVSASTVRAVVNAGARGRSLLVGSIFGALLIAAAAAGQVRGAGAFIAVDEIRPGMRGYGLTVFRGTTPERFDVEVIDVLHNFRPDQDLILIRTEHPILEHANVVAGMSGSPIYLDGRLAGAYAYGWTYSRDPVAGVTPIRNMVAEMRRPYRPTSFPVAEPPLPERGRRPQRAEVRTGGLAPYLGEERATATSALEAHAARFGASTSSSSLRQAATPLLVGGFSDDVARLLDQQLGGFGLTVLQAGGAGEVTPAPGAPTLYQHGSAVGVQLVRGDIAATAVGTVTHVDGARVSAFGHPMLNAGETGLPTAVARVLHILSSVERSFKISEPVRSVGALVHDRQSSIVVDTGVRPATVDLTVRLHGVPDAPRTEWHAEIASHRVLTPVLINATIVNAVTATAVDSTDVMFEATSRVWIAGRRDPIELRDQGFGRAGAASPLTLSQLRLFSLREMIYGNPFEEARAARVEVDLSLRFARETTRIVDASIATDEVDPGGTVPLRVVLRRWNDAEEVRIVPVRIPERAAGEQIHITVEGGAAVDVEHGSPRNLEELLATIHQRYAPTSMVVSLDLPSRGLRFGGHVVRDLPRSALDTLQLRNDADRARPFTTHERREVALGEIVSGNARVDLQVRRTPRP